MEINVDEKSWTIVESDYGGIEVNLVKANIQKAKADKLETA
jgi:hypothetical protein